MRALADEKAHTMRLMLEQERRNVDQLRQEVAAAARYVCCDIIPHVSFINLFFVQIKYRTSTAAAKQSELEAAVRRMAKLQEQLEASRSSKVGQRHAGK